MRADTGVLLTAVVLACACDPAPPTPTASAPGIASASGEDPARSRSSRDGSWRLEWRPLPDPIPLNRLFELEVSLAGASRAANGASLAAVSARMPDHGHGMTVAPRVHALGADRYRVGGMLFHMPGLWELDFEVVRGAQKERLRFEVMLE